MDKWVLVRQDFENVGTGGFVEYDHIVASTYTEPEGEGNPESQDLGELDPDGDMGDEENVFYLRNESEDPERTSSQPAAGVDAALGSAFNSGGRRNDRPTVNQEEESTIDTARRVVGTERNADLDIALNAGGGDESEEEEEFSFEQTCALEHEFQYTSYTVDRSPAISAIVSEQPMTEELLSKLGYCTATAKITVCLAEHRHIIRGTNKLEKNCFFVDIVGDNGYHIVSLIDRYPQLFRNMNRSCTIKVPGNPEWEYPVYKIIGQHSGPGTVIKEARHSPRNTGGSTKWTGTPDEYRKLSFDEWNKLAPTYCPSRDSVETYLKMIKGWEDDVVTQLFAELMVRSHFNQYIHVLHCPQLDGICKAPLSKKAMAYWDVRYVPDFVVDPSQGPVLVPVSYTDMRKLVVKHRKNRKPISLFFTCDWMPGPRALSEGLSMFVQRDPHLREYKGYAVFNSRKLFTILKALNEVHDKDYKKFEAWVKEEKEAREKELRAERAAAREAARIASEEARAARAAAREVARIAAEEAEAARIQAQEDEEDDPTPTPTPTRGDGTIAPERRVDETVHVWIENPETGKKQRVEVDSPLHNKLKKMGKKRRRR
eukprot:SAG11_NODE_4096_length_2066_cov_122.176411_2_plen_599_part_00